MPPKMDVNRLQEGLQTKRFGKRLVFLRGIGSTNDYAKELASYGAEEGTVVIAETQTKGRGRLERGWISPKGGLYMSLILKPSLRANEAVKLVFVASLATAEILKDLYGLRVETKWPNDVLVKGKKICGILCEMNATCEKVNFAVVGIGVNVNFNVKRALPRELAETSTSFLDELGRQIGVEDLFGALVEKLEKVYLSFLKEGFAIVLDGWKKHAKFLGKSVEVTSGADRFSGIAVNVDCDGSLILRQGDNLVRIVSGDLSLR